MDIASRVFSSYRENVFTELSDSVELYKASPFTIYDNMQATISQKKDFSFLQYHQIKKSQELSQLHIDVLAIVYEFTYLNAFLIRKRLAYLYNSEPINSEHMRKVLKSLVSYGLLTQYELLHPDDNGVMQGSPFFYSITVSGAKFLKCKKIWTNDKIPSIKDFSIANALSILAENQFVIMFESQYSKSKLIYSTDLGGNAMIACDIRISYELRISDNSKLDLLLFAIRQDETLYPLYLDRLIKLQNYAKEHKLSGSVILICENELEAMEFERKRREISLLDKLELFYVTDYSLVKDINVLDRLIDIHVLDNICTRNVFRWNLLSLANNQ